MKENKSAYINVLLPRVLIDYSFLFVFIKSFDAFFIYRLEMDVEPIFVSMALYDSRERKKVC